eukprot:CAMPEP_0170849640 /NCGR_PEP_ID=MMETSP0734-20130129/10135_1 /TAXON_ID=186038 /ORGANISM="Fragilariopsis kerguelensis, Strain L26-C5" /LENGTH=371 /DNA_ID=CAMNT_0011219361 /DNA_START=19 /DNA_END=1134 /DNA_ORIENTATION=+
MSRRRGEFEHRTSIFEGAFRAWSHLGGLGPEELENKASTDLDPLSNPIENDTRLLGKKENKASSVNPNGSKRRQFPYEPLPRSGLAHPYVQAILSPWLGPDADNDAIQLGLTTLRTWWQHRRKGESGSAIAALGTDKMKGVVEGYTRHFFTLAHCLIINDKEQPPRTLHAKMRERKKGRGKRKKQHTHNSDKMDLMGLGGTEMSVAAETLNNQNLSPLERPHIVQPKIIEGLIAFPNASTNSRSPQPAAAAADVPPQMSTSTPPRVLRFTRISSGGVVQQVLLVPRDIGDDKTVHDAMVVAQQRKQTLFMDDGTGDIEFSYNYNGVDLQLGYNADSKHTILRDLFDLTEKGNPLELKYSYGGNKNTILQLV